MILDDYRPIFLLSKDFSGGERVRTVEARGCLHANKLLKAALKLAPPSIKILQTEEASECANKANKDREIDW